MKDKLIEIHAALELIKRDITPGNIWHVQLSNITNNLDTLIFDIELNEDD